MPIKDLAKKREYQKNWISQKRSRQNNVEPNKDNLVVEPLKKGRILTKCFYCSQKIPLEKKYTPYFAPICGNICFRKAKKEDEKLETRKETQNNHV